MMAYKNLLEYIKEQSKVDLDSQDISVAVDLGPFVDCTSNQADAYDELLKHRRVELLHKSVAWARKMKDDFPEATFEELAAVVSMVNVVVTMAPHISGLVHVMANPKFAFSSQKLVEDAQRILEVFRRVAPSFDISKVCIKVTATWEGLDACRKLKHLGIQTLATTVFTTEQAMLAAESGCIYVAPFVHDLDAVVNGRYNENDNIMHVCLDSQAYFQEHSYNTQVKAAAIMSIDEIKKMAGVAAMTIPADLLRQLHDTEVEPEVERLSIFKNARAFKTEAREQVAFAGDEEKYREAFSKSEGGKGQASTEQAIEIFCGFQNQLETLMRDTSIAQLGVVLGSPDDLPLNLQPGMVNAVAT